MICEILNLEWSLIWMAFFSFSMWWNTCKSLRDFDLNEIMTFIVKVSHTSSHLTWVFLNLFIEIFISYHKYGNCLMQLKCLAARVRLSIVFDAMSKRHKPLHFLSICSTMNACRIEWLHTQAHAYVHISTHTEPCCLSNAPSTHTRVCVCLCVLCWTMLWCVLLYVWSRWKS